MSALGHLPGPDLDRLIPTICLRKWLNSGQLQNSFNQIDSALGDRPLILDLGNTRNPPQGSAELELAALHDPAGGFANWVDLIGSDQRFIPTLQWSGDANCLQEFEALAALGKGIVFRFRRTRAWNLPQLMNMGATIDCTGVPTMCILDFGQIALGTDLTAAAAEVAAVASALRQRLVSNDLTLVIAGSSFPVDFASIHREHARIPIRERELFSLASAADVFTGTGVSVIYGDFASVFAGERGFAQRGAPRVDYPSRTRWTYYRREIDQSFAAAANLVTQDIDWDENLVIWGTNEIRRAAAGDTSGLGYQRAWTAVRIHLHLHQQLNYGGGDLYENDESWTD